MYIIYMSSEVWAHQIISSIYFVALIHKSELLRICVLGASIIVLRYVKDMYTRDER